MINRGLPIDNSTLSTRTINALHRNGIHFVGELLDFDNEKLMEIRNIGAKSITEIIEYKNECMYSGDENAESVILEDAYVDEWIRDDKNKTKILKWLKDNKIKTRDLCYLSSKTYNTLIFSGYDYVYQFAFLPKDELRFNFSLSSDEIEQMLRSILAYLQENFYEFSKTDCDNSRIGTSIFDAIYIDEYRNKISEFVKANDIEIEESTLSNRAIHCLLANDINKISDIIFCTKSELLSFRSMGSGTANEIAVFLREYLSGNETRIEEYLNGNTSVLFDDQSIISSVLELYKERPFIGFSLSEMLEALKLPSQITVERFKKIIGKLLADNTLEYVDFRCYRIYDSFSDFVKKIDLPERDLQIIERRLNGETFESIGFEYGLTRERIRQLIKKTIKKVRKKRFDTGCLWFDEDYYKYLYQTYYFDKKDASKWLGISNTVWNYFSACDIKQGVKSLEEAMTDTPNIEFALRLKIKNYLNRNKILIDEIWVEKKRTALEPLLVKKFCQNTVAFDDFCKMFNNFLEEQEIPFDENLYYTDEVYRTRKNRISDADFLLWKLNENIRYYDIKSRDYQELFDVLNLESYENIELSTLKFFESYPEIMEKYDIRDQYELHNLLRKILPDGSYHDFRCGRMPMISFGNADRNKTIYDLLVLYSPISNNDFGDILRKELGYEQTTSFGTYLQPFSKYFHHGVYYIEEKLMSGVNKAKLKEVLTDDFYYFEEIKSIYQRCCPNACVDEVNPYNLKNMGFIVLSNYVIQNHSTLEEYFESVLLKEDVFDVIPLKVKYGNNSAFYQKIRDLKHSYALIEFEENKFINIKKLEKYGVTVCDLQLFCDDVFDYANDDYFTIHSIVLEGFDSNLFALGFDESFYASVLSVDDRFSSCIFQHGIVLKKGFKSITAQSFIVSIVEKYGKIDFLDLIALITDNYGCFRIDKYDVKQKLYNTEIYYDQYLDRVYSNEELFYKELEDGDFHL